MKRPEGSTEQSMETLKAQIEQLRNDVASLTQTIGAVADKAGVEALDQAERVAHDVRARSRRAANAVVAEVEEKPLLSVGAALVIGFALGAFFTRNK